MKSIGALVLACFAISCAPIEPWPAEPWPVDPRNPHHPAPYPPAPPHPPAPAPTDPRSPRSYVGLPIGTATVRANAAGIANRVIEVDGEPMFVTQDYRPDRLNFAVRSGVVIRVTHG